MKLTSILAVLASSGFLDMVAADDQSAVKSASTPVLKKRDAFTCYGYTNTSVSDCHKVVDNIRNDKQQDITLWPDVCAVWVQGAFRLWIVVSVKGIWGFLETIPTSTATKAHIEFGCLSTRMHDVRVGKDVVGEQAYGNDFLLFMWL
ncbi:hypothetical protein F4804DRAFT_334332 [Jackrogersella minutella]|nr:hypothetical protein F4804DRAFT_334332 [Jackrogersella minutella]